MFSAIAAANPQPDHGVEKSRPLDASHALSLRNAIEAALHDNLAVRTSGLDRLVQMEQLNVAESEFSPKFTLSGQQNNQIQNGLYAQSGTTSALMAGVTLNLPTGTQIGFNLNRNSDTIGQAAVSQPLTKILQITQHLLKDAGSAATIARDTARLNEQINQYQHDQLVDSTVASTILSYYQAVQAQDQVDVMLRALERARQGKDMNQALYEAGRLAKLDLLQADADIAQAELNFAQAQNAATAAKSDLLRQLGPEKTMLDPAQVVLTDAIPQPDIQDPGEEAALARASTQRKDLQIAQLSAATAALLVAQQKNDRRPQLDLVVEADSSSGVTTVNTLNGQVATGVSGPNYSIGLAFNIPLDASALRLQQRQAQVAVEKAELTLQSFNAQIHSDVVNAVRELQFSLKQYALGKTNADLNQQKLESEIAKFRAGKTSSFQLSSAQDAFRVAEQNRGQTLLAVQRAQIQMWQITGSMPDVRRQFLQ